MYKVFLQTPLAIAHETSADYLLGKSHGPIVESQYFVQTAAGLLPAPRVAVTLLSVLSANMEVSLFTLLKGVSK